MAFFEKTNSKENNINYQQNLVEKDDALYIFYALAAKEKKSMNTASWAGGILTKKKEYFKVDFEEFQLFHVRSRLPLVYQ